MMSLPGGNAGSEREAKCPTNRSAYCAQTANQAAMLHQMPVFMAALHGQPESPPVADSLVMVTFEPSGPEAVRSAAQGAPVRAGLLRDHEARCCSSQSSAVAGRPAICECEPSPLHRLQHGQWQLLEDSLGEALWCSAMLAVSDIIPWARLTRRCFACCLQAWTQHRWRTRYVPAPDGAARRFV